MSYRENELPATREAQAWRHAEILRMYNEGKSDQEIADELGMKRTSVEAVRLRKFKIKRRQRRVRPFVAKVDEAWLRQQFEERVAVHYRAGDLDTTRQKIRQIAEDAGVVYETIRRRLRYAGLIETEATADKTDEEWERAEALLKSEGWTYAEVSRQLGFNVSTLRDRFPGLGLQPEDRGAFMAARKLERKLGLAA